MDCNNTTAGPPNAALAQSIDAATRALLELRQPDGHWVFELEADCTIPAEYLLLRHFLGGQPHAVRNADVLVIREDLEHRVGTSFERARGPEEVACNEETPRGRGARLQGAVATRRLRRRSIP